MEKLFLILLFGISFSFASDISEVYEKKNQISDTKKMKTIHEKKDLNKEVMRYFPQKSSTQKVSIQSSPKCGAVSIPTH